LDKINITFGGVIMGIMDKLFGTEDNENNQDSQNSQGSQNNKNGNMSNAQQADDVTLELRKEELDINKNKVQTGEVILSKDVIEEQQSVNVPVSHEEVVIERKTVNNQPTDSQIESSSDTNSGSNTGSNTACSNNAETIRIPLTEEQVQVGKHTVITEEISAHKREVQQSQQIQETLRREEAHIDKNGNPAIVNDDNTNNFQ
jgi:stress response protein YsnF